MLTSMLRRVVKNEKGVLALEYALLVAFIGLVIIVGVTAVGTQLNAWYGKLATFVGGMAS